MDEIKQLSEMDDKEILKEALDLLAGACELLFELDGDREQACAVMADNTLRYAQDTYYDRDPRLSDQTHYEKKLNTEEENGY
jgi:hypothetical protein